LNNRLSKIVNIPLSKVFLARLKGGK